MNLLSLFCENHDAFLVFLVEECLLWFAELSYLFFKFYILPPFYTRECKCYVCATYVCFLFFWRNIYAAFFTFFFHRPFPFPWSYLRLNLFVLDLMFSCSPSFLNESKLSLEMILYSALHRRDSASANHFLLQLLDKHSFFDIMVHCHGHRFSHTSKHLPSTILPSPWRLNYLHNIESPKGLQFQTKNVRRSYEMMWYFLLEEFPTQEVKRLQPFRAFFTSWVGTSPRRKYHIIL